MQMSKSQYNPEIHHRRSIRLKGHDYAGGGLYFVTLCAHRELRATCVSPLQPFREMIAREWSRCGEVRDDVFPGEYVVMPDHFHGLIRIQRGTSELGHVIGAFKAAVSRRIRRGDTHVAPGTHLALPPETRIWHRNYYEMIVRSAEAEQKIAQYIRMNPWRCVQNLGGGLRGMGNPSLWNVPMLGICCSRNAPQEGRKIFRPDKAAAYLGGFHSPMEKEIFAKLLEHKKPLIWCPAWGLERAAFAPGVREALEDNRMLILEMRNLDGDLAAAEQRNRFVLENADKLWLPHVSSGGMIDRLVREMGVQGKRI